MTLDERPTLLAIQHVPWEGPHRILDACGALHVKTVKPLAGALGAEVRPGEREIGFVPVEVSASDDPLLGGLAPSAEVLHWHGDCFDLPDGAEHLASSERTPCQAFRAGSAWGVLFHPEADFALVEAWLEAPTMIDEARTALGDEGAHALPEWASELEAALIERTAPGFEAFAGIVARG